MAQNFPHSSEFAKAHAALSRAELDLSFAQRAQHNARAKLGELFEAQARTYVHAVATSSGTEKAQNKRGARYSFERAKYYRALAAKA